VGHPPFESKDEKAEDDNDRESTFRRIAKVQLTIPNHVSEDAKDLICKVRLPSLSCSCLNEQTDFHFAMPTLFGVD